VFVAPVIVKDGHGATVMKPRVVRDAIVGGVPSLPLPGAHRDSTCAPMREKLGALIGVSRGDRVAHGHFQAELRVAVGGCEVERAEDCLLSCRVLWCRHGRRCWPRGPRALWGRGPRAHPWLPGSDGTT
jgi:hypothetical protein